MNLKRQNQAVSEHAAGRIENKTIPAMREAVDLVRMVLFLDLRRDLADRAGDISEQDRKLLAGTVVNNLFSQPLSDPVACEFATRNRPLIEKELRCLAERFPDLRPHLTDALRMQTICDNQEGSNSLPALLLAKALGILEEDRPLPLPSTFMIAVRSLGTQRGLVKLIPATHDLPSQE